MIGWLRRLFRSEVSGTKTPESWFVDWLSGTKSASGIRVNAKAALTYSSVYQAVNLLSGDVAKLPLHLYKRRSGSGKDRATEHPAFFLMRRKPCPEMGAFQFMRTLTAHALLRGNGYGYIFRDSRMKPEEIIPLDPSKTYPVRTNGQLWYVTTVDNQERKLSPANVLHIRGMGYDAIMGYSVVDFAKESLGLGLAAERFGSTFFGSGSISSGIMEYPGKLDPKEVENLRRSWDELHQGLEKSHKVAIFENGMTFKPLTIPPEQAQFLGTRKFQRVEVASWFNLPPHRLGDETRTSRASLEQENQSYLESSLDPWLCIWEEECWDKLLTEEEKQGDQFFFEFMRLALLRPNAAARAMIYHNALQDGWMNRDEVRDRENMNPLPDGEGEKYFIPKNMDLSGEEKQKEPPTPDNAKEQPEPPDEVIESHRQLLIEACRKMVRWEVDAVGRCTKKKNFLEAVDAFYGEHEKKLIGSILPAVRCIASVTGGFDAEIVTAEIATEYVVESKQKLLAVAGEANLETLAGLVESQISNWESVRPQQMANQFFVPEKSNG